MEANVETQNAEKGATVERFEPHFEANELYKCSTGE